MMNVSKDTFYKQLGINEITLTRALNYINDKISRLKRQLISDLQDDKMETAESYDAIVRLYEMEGKPLPRQSFCKELGKPIRATGDYDFFGKRCKHSRRNQYDKSARSESEQAKPINELQNLQVILIIV